MNRQRSPLLLIVWVLLGGIAFSQGASAPTVPETPREQVTENIYGVTISDPYRWLEDQKSPQTRAWIEEQNKYSHVLLDSRPGREKLEVRFGQLRKVTTMRLPIERGGRYVYEKRLPNQDQYVIYGRSGRAGQEQVLIDPNPMSPDHSINVKSMELSHDGKLLLYELRHGGRDETEMHLLDIEANRQLPDTLPTARYWTSSFLPDGSGFYYSVMTDEGPRLRFHQLGKDTKYDADIFGKGYGKEISIDAEVSEDGKRLVVAAQHGSAGDKVDVFIQQLVKRTPLTPFIEGVDARFIPFIAGDTLFLQTNWKAPRGRVLAASFDEPDSSKWREIVPESADAIAGMAVAGGKIFVTYVHNAASVVKIFRADGKPTSEMQFPALGSVTQISGRWEGKEAFAGFQSFTVAPTIFCYETATNQQSEWARVHVPVDSSQFEAKQIWFNSKDGTRVPMYVVHKRGLELNGNNPVLLTGYGGFNVSLLPRFSPEAIVWAEKGGVLAQVNLRGGGEFGEEWHRAGMLEHKQNVFDDFIRAAQKLIQDRYTNPNRLAIQGGSNGGLLVGVAMTQRPDLFRAVICLFPLLDMLRYQKFMEARSWVSEYGSVEDPDQFRYIYAYSPYQHVTSARKYPAVLFMTGDGDTRVAPLHACKMTALMQTVSTQDRPAILRYELVAGHAGGSSSVTQAIGIDVDMFTFLFWQLSIQP